jgi:hypothetical protein
MASSIHGGSAHDFPLIPAWAWNPPANARGRHVQHPEHVHGHAGHRAGRVAAPPQRRRDQERGHDQGQVEREHDAGTDPGIADEFGKRASIWYAGDSDLASRPERANLNRPRARLAPVARRAESAICVDSSPAGQ